MWAPPLSPCPCKASCSPSELDPAMAASALPAGEPPWKTLSAEVGGVQLPRTRAGMLGRHSTTPPGDHVPGFLIFSLQGRFSLLTWF